MKNALIIFVKNPEKGKVKTRLAAKVGDEKALDIYLELLEHTRSIITNLSADKFVFYSDDVEINDLWQNNIFNKKKQSGDDLGKRMLNAFNEMFSAGYQKVFIIGSDCIELTTKIIEQGFRQLEFVDVVIGPATDGGYYFLGIKKLHIALFEKIEWSTANVFKQTITICENEKVTYSLLPLLNDIDEEEDWIKASAQYK